MRSRPVRGRDAVFLFPGQGATYPGMGRGLYTHEPAFRGAVDDLASTDDEVEHQSRPGCSRDSTSSSFVNSSLPASRPPSTRSTVPVIHAASSEDRKSAAFAMSSGVPMRPSGYHLTSRSNTSGSSATRSSQAAVAIEPGAIATQRTPAWPVLLGNLLREVRRSQEGFPRRQLSLGETLAVVTRPGARYALEGPEGARPLFGAGALSLPPPAVPGRYSLERDGDPVDAVEVLPLDARESDLRGRGEGDRPAQTEGDDDAGGTAPGRARWPLLVLLAALMADFHITRRTEVK